MDKINFFAVISEEAKNGNLELIKNNILETKMTMCWKGNQYHHGWFYFLVNRN